MSILIKGMEMPTSCRACQLKMNCDDCEGWECVCVPLQQEIGYLDDLLTDKRRDDCPLVPVPPHGRLIDESWLRSAMITTLEALKKNPKMDRQEMHLIAAFDMLRVMIEDAPTIIPASEEGET